MDRITLPLFPINEQCCWALQICNHLLKLRLRLHETHSRLWTWQILCRINHLSYEGFVIQLIKFLDLVIFSVMKLASVRPLYSRKLSHVVRWQMLPIRWRKTPHGIFRWGWHVARGPSLHKERPRKNTFIFFWLARRWLKLLKSYLRWIVLFSLWGEA